MKKPDIIKNHKIRNKLWDEFFSDIFSDNNYEQKDRVVFTQFIILMAHSEEALELLDAYGTVYESTDKDGKLLLKSNPAHKIIADNTRMAIAYYQRFGLSDYDRKVNDKKFQIENNDDEGGFDDIA